MLILARVAAGQRQHIRAGAGSVEACVFVRRDFGFVTWVRLQVLGGLGHDVHHCPRRGVHPLEGGRQKVRGAMTRDASQKQILRRLSSVGRIQPCLFHFGEVNVELRSLGPADLLAHFLQKRPQRHLSVGGFVVSAGGENVTWEIRESNLSFSL